MSVKFFGNQRAVFRFDPDTCETAFYEKGRWVASNDPFLLDEIRFRTVELSRSDALSLIGGTDR